MTEGGSSKLNKAVEKDDLKGAAQKMIAAATLKLRN